MRRSFQLGRVFGIRIGVSASWFVFLFLAIYVLSGYFHAVLGGSQTTAYAVAVGSALGYVLSIVLHELGHALVARRLGIPIAGIELWFFGGLSQMRREPESARQELAIALAGPLVTASIVGLCVLAGILISSGGHFFDVALGRQGFVTTPGVTLVSWLGTINFLLLAFNLVPAFPLDGGRVARAIVWCRTGDRDRGTRLTGRAGQGFALVLGAYGLYSVVRNGGYGFLTLVLALILYQAASAAVGQGTVGQRLQGVSVADIMDREPVTIPADHTLLGAQDEFFLRYRWPWFAVVDGDGRFLGVASHTRVEAELAAGRPALLMRDALEENPSQVTIGENQPLEALLRSEGLRRLGAVIAVDGDGVLAGVVTMAQVRRAMTASTT